MKRAEQEAPQLGGAFLYNQCMRRLALSALGGVVIPLTYLVVLVSLERVFGGRPVSSVLIAPIDWPY